MSKSVFDIPAAQSWIRRWVDSIIYGSNRGKQTIVNVSTDRPIFFCKVKPNTSAIINLKVSGPNFQGSINLAVTVGLKTELNKAGMSVLSASIPAFFSGSTVYLATSVDGLLEDFIFIGFSVPTTGTFTVGMQAVSSERNGLAAAAFSVPMSTVPNVQFKVSDGYLAGYPVIRPIRQLDALRQWSAAFQYVGEDPVFFHGSAYFANPSLVPDVGESPASAPAKWIQLARPDPGPMDITEGAKTPQLFYQPGLIISNTTALKLRKAHQDQGMQYPSLESRVYHFDDDILDQDQQNPLNIVSQLPEVWYNDLTDSDFLYNDVAASEFAYNAPDLRGIAPHFVNEDSIPEPPMTVNPAIAKKPFKEVPSFYYGTYKVSLTLPDNAGENVLDFWFKFIVGGGFRLFDIELPTGEAIKIYIGYEEPFYNDNSDVNTPDNFPYNSNVLMPGSVVYNERDVDGDLAILQEFSGGWVRKDFTVLDAPQPSVWNHISLRIGMDNVRVFLNGKQESFDRLSSGFGGDSQIDVNPDLVAIGMNEILVDPHHSVDLARFNEVSGRALPWAYHEWKDGWLTIYGDDPVKIDSNLALHIFPVGSVITQASTNGGTYDPSQTPWERFHNFTEDNFVLQGELAPSGGNGEKTRLWQRVS
jgi:hypothetical protein